MRSIDPFSVTDADTAFPSGDAFTVYPYKNGAVESVRSEVFYQALQDMRAMKLLGEMTGKDNAVACIEKEFGKITFSHYPRKTESILRLRKIVNKAIERKSI